MRKHFVSYFHSKMKCNEYRKKKTGPNWLRKPTNQLLNQSQSAQLAQGPNQSAFEPEPE